MQRLTDKVHGILRAKIQPGDVAIDATAGNGHDTLFLAKRVGPAGRVFALDLQPEAISKTRGRLAAADCKNVQLLLCDHSRITEEIPSDYHGQIAAVTFNLGYLPGSDKTFVTKAQTSRRAIFGALSLLREGGILTVVAYTGHPGGLAETETVWELVNNLPKEEFSVENVLPDRVDAPRLFVVIRQGKPQPQAISAY